MGVSVGSVWNRFGFRLESVWGWLTQSDRNNLRRVAERQRGRETEKQRGREAERQKALGQRMLTQSAKHNLGRVAERQRGREAEGFGSTGADPKR